MNLQIEAAMVRVFISLYWYGEYGGVETDNFAGDFETLDEARYYVYNVVQNNRAYKYDIELSFFPPKHIETITINLDKES